MKATLLAVVVGIQISWVLAIAGYHERAVREGTVILVETVPVDPRDLLRGDFVRVGYEFSSLAGEEFTPPVGDPSSLRQGTPVYVEMAREGEGRFHRRVRASREPLEVAPGNVMLRGRVRWVSGSATNFTARVEYGVEQYYVAEGSGTPPAEKKMTAELSVSGLGQARLKAVYLDDRPYAEVMRE